MITRKTVGVIFGALLLLLPSFAAPARATEAAWARLAQGGYTILLGHARTSGTGEPRRLDIGDCANRRPLSDRGIQEARRISMRFAARAVALNAVLSGEYCRALVTAELGFGEDRVETRPWLNPPAADTKPGFIPPELIAAVDNFNGYGNQLMITHPVLISAITGTVPREGEAIIIEPGPNPGDPPRVVNRLLLD
ncbi:hypothetical protein DFR52_105155 [Hoeflea marina]|uniref:Histidine phosphatase superfamily protein (Branch 1) n=1 Tax=Hoeflea marina TaxID=274592 RepID=A0A317PFQ1_9HYPH|nr:histidine phosphatase family protein [Hoeflea marina]PWV98176.1 hypothetical protein DFR52_105155 [Hoeflea marina]